MDETADTPIRVTRRFEASAERVFDAWIDPALARRFLFATATGEIVRCDIDARVGGRYTIVDRREGEDVEHVGEYVAVARPHRLVFTLQVPKYSHNTDQTAIDIAPAPGRGCELTLSHYMNPVDAATWAESTRQGWTDILQKLATVLAT